jgi:hypothetical protein
MPLHHRLLLLVALTSATGCHFEDRTPGGAQRDDTSLEQATRNFYVALAAHDPAAVSRAAFSSASVLVDGRGGAAPTLVPINTMIAVPDPRTSGVTPRIVRTELRTDGNVATARVVIAQAIPSEMEAVDFLTLAREGTQWRVAHAVFGPWRTRTAP